MNINVLISNPDSFMDILGFEGVDGIYIEQERVDKNRLKHYIRLAHEAGKKIYIALPYMWNDEVMRTLNREIITIISMSPDGYLVRNLDELGLLAMRNAPGIKILDAGMYTWNRAAMDELKEQGADSFTIPYELNYKDIIDRTTYNSELVAYGYYPMMISNNCVRLTSGKCVKEKDPYGLMRIKDRTGTSFPVQNSCRYCYNIIFNSVPTWLLDEEEINDMDIRFNFTIEKRLEIKSILSRFFEGDLKPKVGFTRGHFKRGAQ